VIQWPEAHGTGGTAATDGIGGDGGLMTDGGRG
jgi:hypothetical protein